MAQNNNHAGVVYARNGYCDFMIRGNEALSNGRAELAIKYYTKILYDLSPGDVCALLNRSIAYVYEGYNELAVTDAYRASLAAREMRHETDVGNTRLDQIVKYIDVERLQVDAESRWTRPEKRNIGTKWLATPLASIIINALPGITPPVERPQDSTSARAWLCKNLEIRAAYRLCGALSILGEGARMDALGLIDNIKSRFEMAKWKARCFDDIGNSIMLQVAAEVDPWEPDDIRALGKDTKSSRNKRMRDLKETMRARSTSGCYGDYPWDRYEPKLREPRWASRVQSWVEAHSQICSAMIIQPQEAEDTIDDLKPYVELRAKRDINPGEIVLSVLSIINLTTSIPEQVQARRHTGFVDHYYCNSCASLLVVPRNCAKKFEKRIVPSTGANLTEHSEPRSSVSSSQAPSSPPDLMFCHPTHMVPTCSAACRGQGRVFDKGLCHTSIEQKLRQNHFNDIYQRSITDRNTKCLRDLIFVRLIARAINLGKNPLGINDIMFATSGPDMRDIGYEEVEHWSFTSHVVTPLRYLDDLFRTYNTDQFERLAQVDGWMLNTLLVKINRVINVSQTPRYVKFFRPDGMLDTAFGPDDDRWAHVPREPADQPTWIASIDSLVWLIGVANPAKGETPNVTIVRREGVHVYSSKAIKAGEPLLRAGNGTESQLQEEFEIASVAQAMEQPERIRMEDAEERQNRMDDRAGNGTESASQEEAREIASVAQAMEELERIRMENAEERKKRMDESTDTQEPPYQTDEMINAAEEHEESKIDIEQYFDALERERSDALNGQSTDGTHESPDQTYEMNMTEEGHAERESGIDIEQYFDELDRERGVVGEERAAGSGAAEGEGVGEDGNVQGSEDAGEESRGEANEDAMLIDDVADRHGDSVGNGHRDHGLRDA